MDNTKCHRTTVCTARERGCRGAQRPHQGQEKPPEHGAWSFCTTSSYHSLKGNSELTILDNGCCPDKPGEDASASVRYGVTSLCVCLRGRVCVRVYHKAQKGAGNCQAADRTCLTICFAFGGQGWEGSSLAHCGYCAPSKIFHLQ